MYEVDFQNSEKDNLLYITKFVIVYFCGFFPQNFKLQYTMTLSRTRTHLLTECIIMFYMTDTDVMTPKLQIGNISK